MTKQDMKRMKKKQIVQYAGYKNIKALCKDNPFMCPRGKAPSKNEIIKHIA